MAAAITALRSLTIRPRTFVSLMAVLALAFNPVMPLVSLMPVQAAADTIFTDGFETGDFSEWTSADSEWNVIGGTTSEGTKKARVGNGAALVTNSALTKMVSTVGYESLDLRFDRKHTLETDDSVKIQLTNDGGATWSSGTNIASTAASSFVEYQVVPNAAASDNSDFGFRFVATTDSASDYFDLDKVKLSGEPIVSAPTSAEITFSRVILMNSAQYTGVTADIEVAGITDATEYSVAVNRADGSTVTKTSRPTAAFIDSINNGSLSALTMPVIIEDGTYGEDDSSSWLPAPAIWSASTAPESVDIQIRNTGGVIASAHIDSTDFVGAAWADITPGPVYRLGTVESQTGAEEYFADLQSAIDDSDGAVRGNSDNGAVGDGSTDTGDILGFTEDLVLSSDVDVTKGVTIDGDGNTIYANFLKPAGLAGNSNNSALSIGSDNVTINNLTVDGASGTDLHGINVYRSSSVNINDTTAKNFRSGVVANGSVVTVENIQTSGNSWHGLNVDKANAHLTIGGNNSHDEFAAIYVDDTTTGAIVTDTDSQYSSRHLGAKPNDLVYNLADTTEPSTPTLVFPADNQVLNAGDLYADWDESTDDVTTDSNDIVYEYRLYLQDPEVNPTIRYQKDYTGSTRHPAAGYASGTPEDTYFWRVRALDEAGNYSDWSDVRKFVIDNTAPAKVTGMTIKQGSSALGCSAYVNQRAIIVDWNDSNDANFDHYRYRADANKTAPFEYETNVTASQRPGNIRDQDGTYNYQVQAVDKAGNKGQWSDWCSVTLDRVDPQAEVTNPADGSVVNGTVTVTGEVTDDNPMNSFFRITGPNSYERTNKKTNGSTTHSFSWDTSGLEDGEYTIFFSARDQAGNKDGDRNTSGDSVDTITVTVDNTAPENLSVAYFEDTSNDEIADGGTTNEEFFKIELTADGNPSFWTLKYWNDIPGDTFNGEANAWTTDSDGPFITVSGDTATYQDRFARGEGTHYFSFSACDDLDNCSDHTDAFEITYDNTAPALDDLTATENEDDSLTLGVTDDGSAESVTFTVLDEDDNVVDTLTDNDGNDGFSAQTGSLTPGTYTILANATDAAGNSTNDDGVSNGAQTTQTVSANPTPTPTRPSSTNGGQGGDNDNGNDGNQQLSDPNPQFIPGLAQAQAQFDTGAVQGTSDDTSNDDADNDGDALQASDAAGDLEADQASEDDGLPWWWWLLIIAALGGGLWLVAARRRRDE